MTDAATDVSTDATRTTLRDRVRELDPDRAGAALLLAAAAAALVWANVGHSYEAFWRTPVDLRVGGFHLGMTAEHVVSDLLMAVFFFTVGLEVKRELVVGDLTKKDRAIVPVAAALAGLAVPAVIFAVVAGTGGTGQAGAWGVVISTDTAFLLGALAMVGPRHPARLRSFLLVLAVVDDIGALAVIAVVYTSSLALAPLLVALGALVLAWFARRLPTGNGLAYGVLGAVVWYGFYRAGIHPTIAGVAMALVLPVFPPSRREVERALSLATSFRQSPTARYAAAAQRGLRDSISVNERLHQAWAPLTSYVILPIFALANAGVSLAPAALRSAATSPVTWAVVLGLVVGKLVGITGATALVQRLGLGRLAPGLGLGHVAGGAALSGIGFTISLLVVGIAIDDPGAQEDARVGVLAASLVAVVLGWAIFRVVDRRHPGELPGARLLRPVDPDRDHVVGPVDAPLELVEYGDFECPFCSRASGTIDDVRRHFGDELRWVWRHLPLEHVHPHARLAARASEAAARQDAFLPFYRAVFADQEHLEREDLVRLAGSLGLDTERFAADLDADEVDERVREDAEDAELMDLSSTPTFFVGGRRHLGPYDSATLIRELDASRPAAGRAHNETL